MADNDTMFQTLMYRWTEVPRETEFVEQLERTMNRYITVGGDIDAFESDMKSFFRLPRHAVGAKEKSAQFVRKAKFNIRGMLKQYIAHRRKLAKSSAKTAEADTH